MRVVANRQLRGSYGLVVPDQEFETTDEIGAELLAKNLVRHALPPTVEYETKVIKPEAPGVSAREPFRNMPLPHEEPEAVASEGPHVLSSANIFESGTSDSRGRTGRPGSRTGR